MTNLSATRKAEAVEIIRPLWFLSGPVVAVAPTVNACTVLLYDNNRSRETEAGLL